jgi:hypothetical protein
VEPLRCSALADRTIGTGAKAIVSLASFLALIVRTLDEAGVPFMLTGSLAAAFYGAPRATQDVDLVIDAQPENLRRFTEALRSAGMYVDVDSALEALRTAGQFNAIDPSTGWKADLIVRKTRPFSEAEFSRRQYRQLLGIEVALTTLEDLIIAKLEWSELGDSELQRRDIRELLEFGGDTLDRAYLERWIEDLGLQRAWDRLIRSG